MSRFNTKYDLATNIYKKYSRKDKVDRLTYVDPVLQIKNFFRQGSQTALSRGQFLYESADAAISEGDTWSVPVYQKDIVDSTAEIERLTAIRNHYRSEYNARMEARKAKLSSSPPETAPTSEV